MSPRPKHIPTGAHQTTICLTDEDRAALSWIQMARRNRREDRKTLNDILVDGLWYLLEKREGKTRKDIQVMVPSLPVIQAVQDKVTEMPKPNNKR